MINAAGIALIRSFEDCSLTAYQDVKGVWTQGIGHTKGITADSLPITPDIAEQWLQDDLMDAEDEIDQHITVDLNDNQYAALTSLVFNCGPAPLLGHIGMYLNASEFQQAADAFLQWDHAGSKIIPGLQRRRTAERLLFLTPVTLTT